MATEPSAALPVPAKPLQIAVRPLLTYGALQSIRVFGLTGTALVATGCRVHIHVRYQRAEEESDHSDSGDGSHDEEDAAQSVPDHALEQCQLSQIPEAVRTASWLLSLARRPQASWFEALFINKPTACTELKGSLGKPNQRGRSKFSLRTTVPGGEHGETTVSFSFEFLLDVPPDAKEPVPLSCSGAGDVEQLLQDKLAQLRPCYDTLLSAAKERTSASKALLDLLPATGWGSVSTLRRTSRTPTGGRSPRKRLPDPQGKKKKKSRRLNKVSTEKMTKNNSKTRKPCTLPGKNCVRGERAFSVDIKTLTKLVHKCQYDSWLPSSLYLFGRDGQTARKIEAWLTQLCTLPRLIRNLRKVTIQKISLPRALVENLTGVFELRLSDISIIEATGRPLVLRAPHCTRLKLERTTTLLTTEFYVSGPCQVHLFKVSSPDISVNWHCRTQGSSLYIEKCGEAIGVRLKNILRQNVQNLDHPNLDILKQ
eukprot:g41242.t1